MASATITARSIPIRHMATCTVGRRCLSSSAPLRAASVLVAANRPDCGSLRLNHRGHERVSPHRRPYFTNTDAMKRTDPFHALGLEWGATTSEIKEAYRRRARALHPDVNTTDAPAEALKKFQRLKAAYDKLMDVRGGGALLSHRDDLVEEWSFAVWRSGDLIAQDRTDVAGEARKRPARPAASTRNPNWGVASLGHPDGRGGNSNVRRRAEYLGDGGDGAGPARRSSTVGTGRNKWVTPKEFVPWNPQDASGVRGCNGDGNGNGRIIGGRSNGIGRGKDDEN